MKIRINLKTNFIVSFTCFFLFISVFVNAQTPENLDEMFARKSRLLKASWPINQLENVSNNYIWQPETLMYKDVKTGHEVWRLTNTPSLINFYHNDIGFSPWSADGKRMGFTSYRNTFAFNRGDHPIQMIVDTNGVNLRPVINGASRRAKSYLHWSPQIPDLYYEFGDSYLGLSLNRNDLYKNNVTDKDVVRELMLSFPSDNTLYPDIKKIDKMISSDGRKLLVSSFDESLLYPTTIYPVPKIDKTNGYSIDRGLALYGDTPPSPYTTAHDRYYAGDGSWYFIMPLGGTYSAWWRLKTIGSAIDGGALCNNEDYPVSDPNYDFGECWPENHGKSNNPSSPFVQVNPYNPSKTTYWSHFVPDRWGRYALFSNAADGLPGTGTYYEKIGSAIWDIQNHKWVVPSFGGGAQHHDWHGFTDYIVSSRGRGEDSNYLNDRIYSAKLNDTNSRFTVCYTHTRYNGGTAYNSLTRPAQSPDGTKVAWHSEFLNILPDSTDIFWTVVYYPYPPTNISASYDNGVKISFLPPKYTERGWSFANYTLNNIRKGDWPELDEQGREIGETLYAREIKKFHIWRSISKNSSWEEIGTVDYLQNYTYHTTEDSLGEMFMLHPVDSTGRKIGSTNKMYYIDSPGNGTFYYAVTSEEQSGIESNELSEILQVTVSGENIYSQVVAPKGQKNFWTKIPQSPYNFSVSMVIPGQYILAWIEPNDSKIRYYNIYYSNHSNPIAEQKYRIASIPKGISYYLDWLADTNSTGYYGITSVDRYGNEGTLSLPYKQCYHKFDNYPCDGCVNTEELTAFIDRWKTNNQDVTIRELIEAIGFWKKGCG